MALESFRICCMLIATSLFFSLHVPAMGNEGIAAPTGTCVNEAQIEIADEELLQQMRFEMLQRQTVQANQLSLTKANSTKVNASAAANNTKSFASAAANNTKVNASAVVNNAKANGSVAVNSTKANVLTAVQDKKSEKGLPDIINSIPGVSQITENLVERVASAVSSALNPLDKGMERLVDATNQSMESLLGALQKIDPMDMVNTFQIQVVTQLNSTLEQLEQISATANTAINASALALEALGQASAAEQISSTLGDVVTFFDNYIELLQEATNNITDLDILSAEEVTKRIEQLNTTLDSVVDTTNEFVRSIDSKLADFLNSTADLLGIPASPALDPIQETMNHAIRQATTSVETLVHGVDEAVNIVFNPDYVDPLRSYAAITPWSLPVFMVTVMLCMGLTPN